MSNRLFVGNLSFDTTEEAVREAFQEFGEVVEAKVITDRMTGRSRGFAFVEMASPESATKAIQEMDGTQLDGRSIRVNLAEARRDGGGGGGYSRDGGGGRRPRGSERRGRW